MLKNIFVLLCFYIPVCSISQTFPGYRTGNYTGVNGVFFNPANIAGNNYKWNVSLPGVNAAIGNNNSSFKFKDIKKIVNGEADSLLFGNTYKNVSAFTGVDIIGPSFMISTKSKWGFAVTSRARAIANITDLDGNLLNSINNTSLLSAPFSLSSNAIQKITTNGWSEFGISIAKVLAEGENGIFKMGLTGKYLGGAANSWLNVNNLKGTVAENTLQQLYLTNTSASISTGYGGYDINNFKLKDLLKFNGKGIGADIGFVYEYRPSDNSKKDSAAGKYKLKIGVSLTDIGTIKYKTADFANYFVVIASAQQWYPSDIDGKSVGEMKQYFESNPSFIKNTTDSLLSYKVSLPAALNINADIALSSNFYTDISGHLNLAGKNNLYSPFTYNSISVTPRYETQHFGIYFPFSYNGLTNFNAGISLRIGPVFIGSGTVLTALLNNSKQADIHFGLSFGGLAEKKRRTKKIKETVVVSEADNDSDGIVNSQDKCPDVFGVARYDGCPVPDTDNDGVNDEEDKCIDVAGVTRYEGCPVPDTDNDGINDDEDKCPQLAGTAENKGCPAIKKEIIQKLSYAARKIYFASSSFKLLPNSYRGLNEVAAILKSSPGLKLMVDGYTDNSGNADKNKTLSIVRADAVKEYLIKKGIEETRITTKGYGDEKPIADNTTPQGKAKNRRVELNVGY